jgi:hypothetical protein
MSVAKHDTKRAMEVGTMADCVVCRHPLATKAGVVFKGEFLIHAACWVDQPKGSPVGLATHRRKPVGGVRDEVRPSTAA